jgi:hypothetical protein
VPACDLLRSLGVTHPARWQVIELGASMIYGGNRYMKQMTEQMGLTTKTYDGGSSWMHIYDGKQVVLQMVISSLATSV